MADAPQAKILLLLAKARDEERNRVYAELHGPIDYANQVLNQIVATLDATSQLSDPATMAAQLKTIVTSPSTETALLILAYVVGKYKP